MFESKTQIRVRYGETDQMGYVYYGNYCLYYEVARVEALRELGLSYKGMEEAGVMLPVMEVKSRYYKPARYDDLLTITTKLASMPGARITFDFEIHNEANEFLHEGQVSLVFVDMKTNRPTKAPESLLKALESYF